jgi:hypothetical protein
LIKYNLDVCYGKYITFNENSEIWDIFLPHMKIGKKEIYYDTFKEQKKHSISYGWILYKDFGLKYDTMAKEFADWDFNLTYLAQGKKIWLINISTFLYRYYSEQSSAKMKLMDCFRLTVYIKKKHHMYAFPMLQMSYDFLYQILVSVAVKVLSKLWMLSWVYVKYKKIPK